MCKSISGLLTLFMFSSPPNHSLIKGSEVKALLGAVIIGGLSLAGCGKTNQAEALALPTAQAPVTAPAQVPVATPTAQASVAEAKPAEKLLKMNSMTLFVSYQSDPFAFREKMVGKNIETSIFVTGFADEGSTARLVDGNTRFYCRMGGADFSSIRKSIGARASIVVSGILAVGSPGSEEIGLNNCKFIAVDDNTWKETDD